MLTIGLCCPLSKRVKIESSHVFIRPIFRSRNPEHQFRRQEVLDQDGRPEQLQLHVLLQEAADEQVDPRPLHRQPRPVHAAPEAGPDGRAADEGAGQGGEAAEADRAEQARQREAAKVPHSYYIGRATKKS